ncbi:MAG: DUF3572 domain-containing protein [Rhizobiaceae bacterium]|nr:DUF3572 domain-containing protein [Rhizobiaceae bacterium]
MIRTSRSAAAEPAPKPVPRGGHPDREASEALAIEALGFVAADPELLQRFLALTGIEAADIRAAARQSGFLAGVLAFVAAHEPTLLAFAASAGRPAQTVLAAMRALPGGNTSFERST